MKHIDRIPTDVRPTGRNLTALAWIMIWFLLSFMTGVLLYIVS
jgi:hypothetical protein